MKKFYVLEALIGLVVALVAGTIGLQVIQNTVGNAGFSNSSILYVVVTNIAPMFGLGLLAMAGYAAYTFMRAD